MIKYFFKVFLLIILSLSICGFAGAEDTTVLSAGISLNSQIPVQLLGSWRVVSKLDETNIVGTFKPLGVDIWNLSKSGNVITLCNPLSGATASVNVEYVNGDVIRFSKVGNYDGQKLSDTVELTLAKDVFTGKNYLILTAPDGTNKKAVYGLKGSKISGMSVTEQ